MNRKGIYTSIIALVILVIIAGTIFYLANPVNEIKADARKNSVREVSYLLLNSRYLFDKATADALADAVYNYVDDPVRCSGSVPVGSSNFETKLNSYYNYIKENILDRTAVECSISSNVSSGAGNADVELTLTCNKLVDGSELYPEFSVLFERTFTFEKTVTANPADGVCTIAVIDEQSGVEEVTQTISLS